MYRNFGDVSFFEHGVLVDTEHSDTVFPMLLCRPYAGEEDLFQFAHVEVDITDKWINREEVLSFAGLTEEDAEKEPVWFAIACTDYYSWEEFGAGSYGVFYDWTRMNRASIEKELMGYLIASDNLDMPWLEKKDTKEKEDADGTDA